MISLSPRGRRRVLRPREFTLFAARLTCVLTYHIPRDAVGRNFLVLYDHDSKLDYSSSEFVKAIPRNRPTNSRREGLALVGSTHLPRPTLTLPRQTLDPKQALYIEPLFNTGSCNSYYHDTYLLRPGGLGPRPSLSICLLSCITPLSSLGGLWGSGHPDPDFGGSSFSTASTHATVQPVAGTRPATRFQDSIR